MFDVAGPVWHRGTGLNRSGLPCGEPMSRTVAVSAIRDTGRHLALPVPTMALGLALPLSLCLGDASFPYSERCGRAFSLIGLA